MKTLVGVDALVPPSGGAAITIGTFDGLHVGHRALIAEAIESASQLDCASCVLTWDRHPAATLRPDRVPPLLTSPERKIELLSDTGVDVLAVLPFDEELSKWPPERFITDVLVAGLGARAVVVGEGWRFGHKATGTTEMLATAGAGAGFVVDAAGLIEVGGEPVSSSRVRKTVAAGDMAVVRTLLGRPYDVDAVVVHGDGRGKTLGFPTANLSVDDTLAQPPRGVYAGRARLGNEWFKAAINVGVNPTFGGDPELSPLRIEAFLLGFSADIYGAPLRLEFWERLRDELHFDSVDALLAQMDEDVTRTATLVD